jgi:DNA-binding transcriptional ArsR family regulator
MDTATPDLFLDMTSIKKATLVFKSVNHPLRRQMLQFLHQETQMTVTQLYIKLRLEQSVVSQHLAVLRKAGVVNVERRGKFILYSLNYPKLKHVQEIAASLSS